MSKQVSETPSAQQAVDAVIVSRRSVRAFLPTLVAQDDIARILEVAARARGLDTCPQAAFIHYHDIIREELGVPASEMVVCGMALGYAAPAKIENRLNTEREPLAGFVKFMDN